MKLKYSYSEQEQSRTQKGKVRREQQWMSYHRNSAIFADNDQNSLRAVEHP